MGNEFRKIFSQVVLTMFLFAMCALCSNPAAGQEDHRWTANVGGGFSPLVGSIDKRLDNGWHVSFGAGAHVTPRFTLGAQVMYNGFGVSRGVIREAAVPDANAHLWAFTAEPRFQLRNYHKLSPYLVGGVGYYRRVVEFTAPTLTSVTIFDPFFGFVPIVVPAQQVLARQIRDGLGGSGGVGFNMPLGSSGAKLYAEARFHYFDGGGLPLRMVPFTVGLRF